MKGILKYCASAKYVLGMAAKKEDGIKGSRSKEYILERLRFGCGRWIMSCDKMASEVKLSQHATIPTQG